MTWSPDTPIEQVRFVVLDSETTGLNPQRDRIVTIGAIAVLNHEILLEDSFEALLKVEHNSSAGNFRAPRLVKMKFTLRPIVRSRAPATTVFRRSVCEVL